MTDPSIPESTSKTESSPSQPQEASVVSNLPNIHELLPSLPSRRIDKRRLLDDDERDFDNIPVDPIYTEVPKTTQKASADEEDSEEYVPVKKRKNLQVSLIYQLIRPFSFHYQ